jgi:nitroimidazol reductase NimA-like FMN-containing flavoprotein (pyridoxamine 5'-phosphate oxidase superfamily)
MLPYDECRPHHRGEEIPLVRMEEILRHTEWGVLANVSADGEPYAVPISYAWDENTGNLIIHTYRQGNKIDNIQRDSRVCFTVVGSSHLITDKFAAGYESLVIFGRIEQITDPDEALRAAVLFCRKFAPKIVEGLNADAADREINDMALMIDRALEYMALYRIIPSHVSSKQRNMT